MRLKPSLIAAAGLTVLLTAACGQQTDDRAASSSPAATTAAASAAPSSGSVQSSIAAATPYVTLDCVSLQGSGVDAPPSSATTIGDVSAIMQPTGAPAITIKSDATPATELGIADMTVGTGAEAKAGDTITVNYCGAALGGKAVFDSSWANGQPATFPLSGLIEGWQQGLPGMKVGGQRLLVIPPALGYGEAGSGAIGPNETLVFVVQLESVGTASAQAS
jgi:peptidylprolyl isomerase